MGGGSLCAARGEATGGNQGQGGCTAKAKRFRKRHDRLSRGDVRSIEAAVKLYSFMNIS